ncbi:MULTISPECIES: FtsQ-type POTRA domain-containing protein [unclassified Staphylococcus]|uniref:cell division protein FtsQ/DivIB n=1 Tax=unclassified Staphylococcus TaxID=91994 RepID=UPI0021CFB996|nr:MULTISPECIES: FtsQ-type POTRA domain-containing protein [unclassified Staphylococcus]UXR77020.1 FtsQ-type POTRA domain-containing protein [Staphylococcus sp. IVB6233]UXR81145.1 FtsQ-type POTRA domain-containing protein [Staphylococcus sp. IVB6218]
MTEKIDQTFLKEKRMRELKKRRRIQLSIVLGLLLIVVAILLYMYTPISIVKSVNVEGNHYVATDKIKKDLKINNETRVYSYDSDEAERRIVKHPLIKQVDINKGLFNTLQVNITEHKVVGIMTVKGNDVPVIENGRILKNFEETLPNEAPYLKGFKRTEKQKLVEALEKMDRTTRTQISEIVYEPKKNQPHLIRLYMRDGIEVLGNTKTIARKLKYYPSMSHALEKDESGQLKQSGYIDLSVGATFIPYGSDANGDDESASSQQVVNKTELEDEAKNELQKALNKIKEHEQDKN